MTGERDAARPRRERSARYPGASLEESLGLCAALDRLGLDRLSAEAIAEGLGYSSIKTNTFSARLSAARQFGLLTLAGEQYALTALGRSLLHPSDPAEVPQLRREALRKPPLYADLAQRFEGKKVPEASLLANILYHHHQITARAKQGAAAVFLESSRYAGALGADEVFRADGPPPALGAAEPARAADRSRTRPADVRLDLRLWDEDDGKVIRVRAPRSISAASFERFLQAFRLVVRVEEGR
jgi:hypothetical protein